MQPLPMGLFGRKKQQANPATSQSIEPQRVPDAIDQEVRDPQDLIVALFPRETFDHLGPAGYEVREPLPGIVAPITIDEGDSIRAQWGGLSIVGMGADEAYERAISNMRARPVQLTAIEGSPEEGIHSTVHLLSAPDALAPGHIFLIQDILTRVGEEFPEHGILVCVPNAVTIAFHVPRDIGVLAGMAKLMEIAQGEYMPELGGITPHIFLLLPDRTSVQCSRFTEDGDMAMDAMSGPLHTMLLKLGVINT